jgi:PAS domain S-box-containing protein
MTADLSLAQSHDDLAALRREFHDFVTYLPDALVEVDLASLQITFANRMANILLGYGDGALVGVPATDVVDTEGWGLALQVHAENMGRLAEHGSPYQRTGRQDLFDVRMRRRDGSWFEAEVQGSYVLDVGGVPARIRVIFRDVSARKRAEADLRRSEEQLRHFAANAPVLLARLDAEGTFVLFEGRGIQALNINAENVRGRKAADLRLPEPLAQLLRRGLEGEACSVRFELRGSAFDAHAEPVHEDGAFAGLVAVATDVTRIARAESALRQAQKMESLGILAGGVAHDFNNILTTVLGVTALMKRTSDGEDRACLDMLETAARRGAEITGRLLAFARHRLESVEDIDLRDVLSEVVRLAEPSLPRDIHLALELPSASVCLPGDAGQLHQALLNMVLNARDALAEGGNIRIALAVEGPNAIVTVEDDGLGMDEQTQLHLFEPFFTTKPMGAGTGLGLSIVYGVVQGHGGTISVRSSLGEGTVFAIRLPLTGG